MGTESQLIAAAQGMLGNIQKAYITVSDDRDISNGITVEQTKASSSLFNMSIVNTVLNAVSNVVSSTLNLPSGNTFVVQFNPSSLHFTGHGGGIIPKVDFSHGTESKSGKNRESESYGRAPVRITLDMTLIFDNVYPANAFKSDKLQMSYSSMAVGALALAGQAAGKVSYSVQPKVEALIGALQNNRTRKITFNWGNLSYKGCLNHVNARYTMFNSAAEPVRAEVYLSMLCADQKVDANSMGQWGQSYLNAFESSNSYVSAAQKASSLLNFSL